MGKAVAGDKLDAVLNVAGGWAGGNASSAEFIKVNKDGLFFNLYHAANGVIIQNFEKGRLNELMIWKFATLGNSEHITK